MKRHSIETRLFVSGGIYHTEATWPNDLGFTFMDLPCSHIAEVPLRPNNFMGRGDYTNVVLACGDNADTANVIKMVTMPSFRWSIVSNPFHIYHYCMLYFHKYCIPVHRLLTQWMIRIALILFQISELTPRKAVNYLVALPSGDCYSNDATWRSRLKKDDALAVVEKVSRVDYSRLIFGPTVLFCKRWFNVN